MKDWLDTATKAAGVLSFAILALAFTYEYGFYSVVGRPLQSLMSVTDYFTSAISWLPVTGAALVFSAIHFALLRRIENFEPVANLRARFGPGWYGIIMADLPIVVFVVVLAIGSVAEFFWPILTPGA